MPSILFKMSSERCQSDYLIRHMHATINYLGSFCGNLIQCQQDTCKRQLCIAIATSILTNDVLALLHNGPYEGSVKVRDNMYRADTVRMLAAVVAVCSMSALHCLINKVRSASISSELYSTPLIAAAANGQIGTAVFIFAYMES
jgi:hypothetical protein